MIDIVAVQRRMERKREAGPKKELRIVRERDFDQKVHFS